MKSQNYSFELLLLRFIIAQVATCSGKNFKEEITKCIDQSGQEIVLISGKQASVISQPFISFGQW